jgi:hypothetical protein
VTGLSRLSDRSPRLGVYVGGTNFLQRPRSNISGTITRSDADASEGPPSICDYAGPSVVIGSLATTSPGLVLASKTGLILKSASGQEATATRATPTGTASAQGLTANCHFLDEVIAEEIQRLSRRDLPNDEKSRNLPGKVWPRILANKA